MFHCKLGGYNEPLVFPPFPSMLNNRVPASFRVCLVPSSSSSILPPPPGPPSLAEQALAIRLWLRAIRIKVTVSPRINPAARLLTRNFSVRAAVDDYDR